MVRAMPELIDYVHRGRAALYPDGENLALAA